jgi:hypothetical protein
LPPGEPDVDGAGMGTHDARMDTDQPCAGCGKPTAAGRTRFADRRKIEHADGSRSYLCAMCDATAASGRGRDLSDEELRRFIENGSMAGIVWSNTGPGSMGL